MILATLLFIQNKNGDYLLLERAKEPNKGLLSPPGGKLESAESPFGCAVREAHEECGIDSATEDWELLGFVTEKNYPGMGNIMMFLMRYKNTLNTLPANIHEGKFHFIKVEELHNLSIPETDKLFIWNIVLEAKRFPFSILLDCSNDGYEHKVEIDHQ